MCTLDIDTMNGGGGSLFVESIWQEGMTIRYYVHWTGRRTSNGNGNCGPDADLILTRRELSMVAAGGGSDESRMLPITAARQGESF